MRFYSLPLHVHCVVTLPFCALGATHLENCNLPLRTSLPASCPPSGSCEEFGKCA